MNYIDRDRDAVLGDQAEAPGYKDLFDAAWNKGYEVGYDDGESSRDNDWSMAFDEVLPDDVANSRFRVAAYIKRLQDVIEAHGLTEEIGEVPEPELGPPITVTYFYEQP